jgi:hypothetical protein
MAIVSVDLAYQTWSDIGIVVLYREPEGIAVETVRPLALTERLTRHELPKRQATKSGGTLLASPGHWVL